MTTSEAIRRIKEHIRIHQKKEPSAVYITEALQMACNALEKQIPKKTRVDDNEWYCCCNCGDTFSLISIVNKRNKFCGKCGQALDWSDTE